jgi:hypothetical protein
VKIIVLCDDRGEIVSVAFPNPELEETLNFGSDRARQVHELDVDEKLIRPEEISRSEEARKEAYALIGTMLRR